MGKNWKFAGFDDPEENWVKLPKAIYENLARFSSEAELKVVLYVLRHTWGYGDDYKALSVNDICHGRRRRDGSQIDNGTGLQPQAVRDGIQRAIDHGFLRVWLDDSDAGRQTKYYMLARSDVEEVPPGTEQLPGEDHPGEGEDHPEVKITHGGGENHRGGRVKITPTVGDFHPSNIDRSLEGNLDRNLDTQQGAVSAAPASHDPFFGQTRASYFGINGQRRRAMQNHHAAQAQGIAPGDFPLLVDKLASIHHLEPVIAAGDDSALRQMQDLAILLAGAPFGLKTPAALDALYERWKRTYRKGDVAPYANSLKNYASSLVQKGMLKDGEFSDTGRGADGPRTRAIREAQHAGAAGQLPALPEGDVDF